jgi:hypothetical protein
MLNYIYDGSFEGLLSCIYEAYYRHENPDRIIPGEMPQLDMLDKNIHISTDEDKATKVYDSILNKISDHVLDDVYYAFLSEVENSGKIIKNSLEIEPTLVLDPCLQFSTLTKKNNESNEGGEFAAVYGHNFSTSFVNKIKKWAYKRKLPLLSIGYRNEWADEQWLTADPIEFQSFIAQSEAVITNFYHGCI